VRWGLVGEGQARSLVVLGPPMAGAARLQAATRAAGTPLLLGAALAALAGPEARAALHPADAEGLAWQLAAVPHG
jgi:class 3 adenylate cyclase